MTMKITASVTEGDRHLKDVYSLLFYNGKLYSSSEDGKVKVWGTDLRLQGVIDAHKSVVYHIAAIKDTIYSCSNDGTVKAWDINTLKHKKTLMNSEDEISRLFVADGVLYAGDDQGCITVFENDEVKLVYNLVEEVRDFAVVGNLIYTIRDRDLVITEMLPGESKRVVTRHTMEGSSPMCIVGNKLCFATRTASAIAVYDNNKEAHYKYLAELQGHSMIINALCGNNSTLYSGSWDKTVKQWDLETCKCTATGELDYCINALAIGPQGEVYAGGANGLISRLDSK
ncbi:myosin heavy chain kinase C [Anabrus simplex]|uniref:myosin heavy chain kinase C n=1 Tax=Anabrus simplex TaxID=316456 RepID=UPI0034DD4F84